MKNSKKWLIDLTDLIAPVFIALAVGAVLILSIGEDPLYTYSVLFQRSLFTYRGFLKTLHFAAPLILTGLAIAITFKANIFNMGVEGQAVLGAFFAGVVGFSFQGVSPALHITLCLVTGIVVGALFALVPALLKAYFKVDEMVVTLMLNYVVIEIVKFLSQGVYRDPASGYVATHAIFDSAMFKKQFSSDLTGFFFIALLAFGLLYVLFTMSKLGYEISAIGKNPQFAEATGMRVGKKIIIIMLISGAVSGLAGAGFLMSEKYRFTLDFSGNPGLGWDGMLVALLGHHNPVGILIAAILYSALKTGSEYIGLFTNVPKDIVGVIQSVIILFLSVRFVMLNTELRSRINSLFKRIKHPERPQESAKRGDGL